MIFFIIFLFLIACYLFSARRKQPHCRLPPGPRCLSVVGSVAQMMVGSSLFHLKLSKWAQEYGKLFTIYIPRTPVVVVNDANFMRELLGSMAATGRLSSEIFTMLMWSGRHGILRTEGHEWSEQKQFCIRSLKQFGFGRQSYMEPIIMKEVEKLCGWLDNCMRKKDNNGLFLHQPILNCTGNVMWAMITGKTNSSKVLQQSRIGYLIQKYMDTLVIAIKRGLSLFPWIKYIIPVYSGFQDLTTLSKEIQEHVEQEFKEHAETRMSGESPRDVIDAYIEKVENCDDKDSTFYGESGWKHSFASVLLLMLASLDTTGTTFTWLIFYLAVNGDVQLKVQQEIDDVIGRNRNPGYADRKNMPYLESVMLETLRFSTLLPAGGTVKLLEDVSFHNYHLPKGTIVIPNLYHAHNDKAIWGDPENFRPGRFLEDNGHLKEFVVTFQPGKRSCPGAGFAKDILFLFAAKLLQMYNFSVDSSVENVEEYLQPVCGVTLTPKRLAVNVTPRI